MTGFSTRRWRASSARCERRGDPSRRSSSRARRSPSLWELLSSLTTNSFGRSRWMADGSSAACGLARSFNDRSPPPCARSPGDCAGFSVAERFLKPHYLFRPSQAARRLIQGLRGNTPGSAEVRLPWGLRLRVDPRESIGGAIWRLGLYDLAVSEALWRLTTPGDLAVDVGANLGHMAGILALRAGPSGRVLAFEPHPDVFADLVENVVLVAGDPRTAPVEALPLALGDTEGGGYLDGGDPSSGKRGLAPRLGFAAEGVPVDIT